MSATDFFFINFIYDFIVNEMLGSLVLFTILIFAAFLFMLFIAKVPRFALVLFLLGLIITFSTHNYVIPKWVETMAYIAVGVIWAGVLLKVAVDVFES